MEYALLQFFNFHVLEPYFVSVILKKYISFLRISEIRPVFIFTVCYQCIPHIIVTIIFNQFNSVQPMFYMVAFYDNGSCIKFFLVERFILRSRNQIIQRATEFSTRLSLLPPMGFDSSFDYLCDMEVNRSGETFFLYNIIILYSHIWI